MNGMLMSMFSLPLLSGMPTALFITQNPFITHEMLKVTGSSLILESADGLFVSMYLWSIKQAMPT